MAHRLGGREPVVDRPRSHRLLRFRPGVDGHQPRPPDDGGHQHPRSQLPGPNRHAPGLEPQRRDEFEQQLRPRPMQRRRLRLRPGAPVRQQHGAAAPLCADPDDPARHPRPPQPARERLAPGRDHQRQGRRRLAHQQEAEAKRAPVPQPGHLQHERRRQPLVQPIQPHGGKVPGQRREQRRPGAGHCHRAAVAPRRSGHAGKIAQRRAEHPAQQAPGKGRKPQRLGQHHPEIQGRHRHRRALHRGCVRPPVAPRPA